jgi:acyl dehydratase
MISSAMSRHLVVGSASTVSRAPAGGQLRMGRRAGASIQSAVVTAAAELRFPDADPTRCHIDADAVYAFARATNDDNERYLRGDAVPPPYTAQFVLGARIFSLTTTTPEPEIIGPPYSLHGEHDIFFHRPVLPGMDLRIEKEFVGAQQKASGVVTVSRFVFTDEAGVPLVEHYWSNFYVGGRIASETGTLAPDHTFTDAARQHPIGSATVTVERDQTYRYAGVSHDHAPHAIDESAARREGYPAKIMQGMCTFSLCSAALVDLVADGDPDRVRRLAVRFSAPAFAGRDFDVDAYDAGTTMEGHRSIAFEAIQGDVKVMTHGRVDVA